MEPKSAKWGLAASVAEGMRGVERERVNVEM